MGRSSNSVQELVAGWVATTPNAPAVYDPAGRNTVSYHDLWRSAGWVAARLAGLGVGKGDIVALSLDRGPGLIVAMLGVIRSGAAYLPVDPHAPEQRVRAVLADAGVSVAVAGPDERRLGALTRIDVPQADPGLAVPDVAVDADDPVYVLFTSGSTGTPKGVVVPHRAVRRLVMNSLFCTVEPGHRVANGANPAFDATTWEVWGALATGGCVVPLPAVTELPIDEWAALLTDHAIDAICLTTSLFHMVARERPAALRTIGTVLVGGEQLELPAARRVLAGGAPGRLVNGYGPTETVTFATYFDCTVESLADVDRIPVGFPLQETTVRVVDDELTEVADGTVGELCIGGPGVALGYLGRADLTAERFVDHPVTGERLYRSGDLARKLPNGAFEVLGRRDRQVKLRGFRVELDEIEAAAIATGLIDAAFVDKIGEGPQALLAAAVVPMAGGSVSERELAEQLAKRLPEYMIPARWRVLTRPPLGPTGKVDRAAITALLGETDAPAAAPADTDPVAAVLRAIWHDVVGAEPADATNFLAIGGNSIMAVQLAGRVKDRLGVRAEPSEVLLSDSFAGLVEKIRAAAPSA